MVSWVTFSGNGPVRVAVALTGVAVVMIAPLVLGPARLSTAEAQVPLVATPTPTAVPSSILTYSGFEEASFAAGGWSTDVWGTGSAAALVGAPVYAGTQAARFTTTTQVNGERAFASRGFAWPASQVVVARAQLLAQSPLVQFYSKVFSLETEGPSNWGPRAGIALMPGTFGVIYTSRDGALHYVDLGLPYANGTWYGLAVTVDYRGANPILTFAVNGQQVYGVVDTTSGSHTDRPAAVRVGFGPGAWGNDAGSIVFDEVLVQDAGALPTPTPTLPAAPTPTATAAPDAPTKGQWSAVMQWPEQAIHAALLRTGKVMMWSHWEIQTPVNLWDPTGQTFTTSSVPADIFCAALGMMADGRVLIVGGHNGISSDAGIATANVFDPQTASSSRAPDMNYARWYPSVTTLGDGRMLVVGGDISPTQYAATPEIYNPVTNSWTLLPGAQLSGHAGSYPQNYLLPSGKVFLTNGMNGQSLVLDIAAQTWTSIGVAPMVGPSSAMYRPGQFIAAGDGSPGVPLSAVIDMNQTSPSWRQTAPMAYSRHNHNLVVLPDGKVLVVGGGDASSSVGVLPAEMWDPATQTWTTMASMHEPRMYHSVALLLPDARVLAAGGQQGGEIGSFITYPTAELYSPAYLFKGARPSITSAPASTTYGATMTVQTPDAASIGSVSFVRLGSNTHNYDMDQRYIGLSFGPIPGGLTVQGPPNANIAPPGYYMLFLVNTNGVPSVAKIIRIG